MPMLVQLVGGGAVVSRPGLLLLLPAIEELTWASAAVAGEVCCCVLLPSPLHVTTLLLALETCVSGSVCCNNSVILTVCCSIPFEATMALAAEVATPVVAPGLLLAELTATRDDAEDSDDGGIEDTRDEARDVAGDGGTTPNTDAGELY